MENNNNAEEVSTGSKRKGSSLSESSSSSDSSSEEQGLSGGAEVGQRPAKRRRRVSSLKFELLSQQVTFLTNLITQSQVNNVPVRNESESLPISTPVPDNPVSAEGLALQPPPGANTEKTQLNISDYSTVVKDPLYPKSNERHLKKLEELQHFNLDDWHSIRFSEAQKKYLCTPGFTELKVNEELGRFEPSTNEDYRLYLLERSFAAMSNAMLIQKDELRNALQNLINWSGDKETKLSPTSLFEKVEQIFNKDSEFMKVSDDLLQITCGRRADFIRLRRDLILKQIPDQYNSAGVEKIPPSSEHLFNSELLSKYLHKIGGAEKLSSGPTRQNTMQKSNFVASRATTNSNEYRAVPSTSKEPKDKPFRSYGSQQGKSNQFKRNKGKSSARPGQQPKGKKPRSRSPPKNRNRRA